MSNELVAFGFEQTSVEIPFDVKIKVHDDVAPADLVESPSCRGDTSGEPERYVCCADCFRWRKVVPSCGQRNCPRCQLKQSRRIMEKYLPAMELIKTGYGRRWIAITLSGYRIPKDWVGQNVYMFAHDVRAFLKKRYLGGLIVIEHTWKEREREYFIHAHALVLGDFEDVKKMSDEWGRFVWLSDMRYDKQGHPRTNLEAIKRGMTYLLKYVSKGVALEDADLEQVKGLRYLSTFGECYNMRLPTIVSRCKFCNGRVGLCYAADIEAIERQKLSKGPEPLELLRVTTWPVKTRYDTIEDSEKSENEFKEWWRNRWKDLAMAWGHLRNYRWLENGVPLGSAGDLV